jgi:hypothetical protein
LLIKTQFEIDSGASNHLAKMVQKSLDNTGMRYRFLRDELLDFVSVIFFDAQISSIFKP